MSGLLVHKDLDRRELTFERELPATVERVWRSWTTVAGLEAWWGPAGWVTTVRALEVHPGGLWHFGMGPAARMPEVWIRSVYSEVVPHALLSYVEAFSDESGADLDPEANAVTVEFIGFDEGRTRLVMRTRFASDERLARVIRMGVVTGWTGAFDRLAERLEEQA
ncbi:SRPBCC family protein [Protaetiibacter larvae]|uniref:SRPBCC domain-containing protein n=1 Tax=Protaetiibacter larvae TaxID=2592654 RepID=A0A5C1Y637_9MICO|nr:SRPBCC domain-containing protein [Protaetiibacter larvae]QEO09170.1 SRPBCC domain-containing protein [Protaetiibacter larvae]